MIGPARKYYCDPKNINTSIITEEGGRIGLPWYDMEV
jgi:hypothetical protein